jgi:hypothetical protein
MARLNSLLALARVSDRRWSKTACSGTERAVELLIGALCVLAMLRQLGLIALGPTSGRLAAARLLTLCLCTASFVIPLSVRPSIPLSSLVLYPLSRREHTIYHVASYLQIPRVLAVCTASLLAVIAAAWVPAPLHHISEAAAALFMSASTGLGLSMVVLRLQNRQRTPSLSRREPISLPFPLIRKEVAYFSRTLDPYLALALSIAAGYSEYLGAWLSPLKLLFPLLIIALVQSSAVLNPFALDTDQERNRYALLPVPFYRIVFQKHIAAALILVATTSPLAAALAYRMSLPDLLASLLMAALVLMSWLYAGLLLMPTPSARQVRMAFGTLSGEGMSLTLALGNALLITLVPLCAALASTKIGHANLLSASGALALITLLYVARLRRSKAGKMLASYGSQ